MAAKRNLRHMITKANYLTLSYRAIASTVLHKEMIAA